MRRCVVYLILGAALVAFGCSEERLSAPPVAQDDAGSSFSPEAAAWAIVDQAGWPVETADELANEGVAQCHGSHFPIHSFERTPITGDIVLYSMLIPVGSGPHDIIGLHRVVKERHPWVPIRTHKAVMFVHGLPGLFVTSFMPGLEYPSAPIEAALPVMLAEDDIDVWGIDLRWSLVPDETSDFDFMADWGTEVAIQDLRTSLATARIVRRITGNGYSKMNLLGWSGGSYLGWAYLNDESQVPRGLRHVRGFVTLDYHFKTDDPESHAMAEAIAQGYFDLHGAGVYEVNEGVLCGELSRLARLYPDDPSSYFPDFTNFQAALYMGTSRPGDPSIVPAYHIVAGVFDQGGAPYDLRYMPVDRWLDFMDGFPGYYTTLFLAELAAIAGDYGDLPYDDHLADITVPIMFAGAGGGFGEYCLYVLTLIGSSDITTYLVDREPLHENRIYDYGHADLLAADDAPQNALPAIRAWFAGH